MPDPETGLPRLDDLRAAIGSQTAGLAITNPEDTGIFNPRIAEFVAAIHAVGGLASYDQANANGTLGITNAAKAGFDLCHFNLHKTFSTPHACGGPAAGASAVTAKLAPFLPAPTVERAADGTFYLDHDRPLSIGKIRPWYGVAPNLVRAYAWIMSLGADGLREVAETAVLNNNYLLARILEIEGVTAPYAEGHRRIEQVRYSWADLTEQTGVTSEEIGWRAADYSVHFWQSHHPWIVPEPSTFEPTESYSKADLDEYAAILAAVAAEARSDPETLHTAPHRSAVHRNAHAPLDDPDRWAVTWRAYRRKIKGEKVD
jgi:glycine dehydrogenase subunit 2